MLDKVANWSWTVLIVPIIMLFDGKADKKDVQEIHEDVKHISDRVDKIYEHLTKN